jgi:hypothetical protein
MLPQHISLALRDVVAGIEEKAHTFGWDAPPVLLTLFHRQLVDDSPLHLLEVEVAPFTLDLNSGASHRLADVLNLLTEFVTTPEPAPELRNWLDGTQRTFVGFALVCEGFRYTPYEGYVYGDVNRTPSMADAEVRLVAAIDTDGRYYEVIRTRGEDQHQFAVHDTLTPELLADAIPDTLSRLVTAVQKL